MVGIINRINMKQILALITFLIANQTSSQELHLQLILSDISVKKDTLTFNYRFTNAGDKTLILFNTRLTDVDVSGYEKILSERYPDNIVPIPRILVEIYDENNELPPRFFNTGPTEDIDDLGIGKYISLRSNMNRLYEKKIPLKRLHLKNGEYRLQLVYFSNNYYKRQYYNLKKNKAGSKDSILFQGIVKSNIVKFNYPGK
jgi:hypothetical protein